MIQSNLTYLIREIDRKLDLYKGMGWSLEWPLKLRNIYIRALCEDQLEHFNKDYP